MLPIQRKISPYNYYNGNDIKFIVIHYIGATGTAKNNVDYFYGGDRQASAHYFVGLTEIWQSVEDYNGSWHCGNTRTEVNNKNSIGIEMECANPNLYVEDKTIQNTCELVAYLMKKYNIPLSNVRTHYEVSGKTKICPNFANTSRWADMKNKIQTEYNKLTAPQPNNDLCRILVNGKSVIALTGLQKCIDYVKANHPKEGVKIQRVSDSAILWTQAKYVAPTPTDNSKTYKEDGIFYFTTAVQIRTQPKNGYETGLTYYAGESVRYHTVILNKGGFNWIQYTRSNGSQGYMKIKDLSTGESYGYAK